MHQPVSPHIASRSYLTLVQYRSQYSFTQSPFKHNCMQKQLSGILIISTSYCIHICWCKLRTAAQCHATAMSNGP
jgi:hypothetical protein